MRGRIIFLVALTGACSAASAEEETGGEPSAPLGDNLSGCQGKASSAIPASGTYVLTTFGGPDEPQPLACGGHSKSGSWYYAASKQRYGCGKHVRITSNGKCVVAQTDDYGPDVCVEKAAGMPIIDASPLVGKALFGSSSLGWSDGKKVKVELVSTSTPLGPCTGSGGSGGSGGSSAGGSGGTSSGGASTGGSSAGGSSAGGSSSSSSCVGHCGDKAPSGCWCDSQCAGYGDCCVDKASACGSGGTGGAGGSGGSGGGSSGSGGGTPCAGDGDCNPGNDGSGLICVGSKCVPGCHTNAQCPGIKTCKSGQCS